MMTNQHTMLVHWIEHGAKTSGDEVPVPCDYHAGFIECPHCGNDKASVLSDDGGATYHTDCGNCDHYQYVHIVELNKYAYAYLQEIGFGCPETVMSWGKANSWSWHRTEDRAALKQIIECELNDGVTTLIDSLDMKLLFGYN